MEWEYHKIDELARISRIYTIFEKSYKADYNFSGESHDFWECVYVESGSICVTADSRVLELSAGEIIFHKPACIFRGNIIHHRFVAHKNDSFVLFTEY